MRVLLSFIILIFIIKTAESQRRLSDKDFKSVLPAAEKYLIEVFGKRNFDKHIKVDFEACRNNIQVDHDKKHKGSGLAHFVSYSDLFFWVIDERDTIGSFNVLVDSNFNVHNESSRTGLDDTYAPALLIGYKKLLTGEMKIGFKQACALGREHGFKLNPWFQVYIGSTYIFKEGKVFVNAKYIWWFSESDETDGYNRLVLNAESGKIEKEEYIKPMPR